ncbi:YkgJ family cysteine cluster protein [Brachyspira intermedia]|uniref:YkgJ family cysteine cluster protein n=1 Tax=Brachyspira intermedia TaxID=84377 RepID=UPI0030078CC6
MNKFPCTSCGEYCRHITNIPTLEEFDKGNGICIYLNEQTDLCEIYKTRPEICIVDVMYDKYFKEKYSKEEFYQLNI